MSSEELDAIFERQTRTTNDMIARGGISNEGDVLRVKGFVKELEDYAGKKNLLEKYLVWRSIKVLNSTLEACKDE